MRDAQLLAAGNSARQRFEMDLLQPAASAYARPALTAGASPDVGPLHPGQLS